MRWRGGATGGAGGAAGRSYTGGLVGWNSAVITGNSYSNGNVTSIAGAAQNGASGGTGGATTATFNSGTAAAGGAGGAGGCRSHCVCW